MDVILDINPCRIRLAAVSFRAIFNYSCTSKEPEVSNASQVVMFKVLLSSSEKEGGRVGARIEEKDEKEEEKRKQL